MAGENLRRLKNRIPIQIPKLLLVLCWLLLLPHYRLPFFCSWHFFLATSHHPIHPHIHPSNHPANNGSGIYGSRVSYFCPSKFLLRSDFLPFAATQACLPACLPAHLHYAQLDWRRAGRQALILGTNSHPTDWISPVLLSLKPFRCYIIAWHNQIFITLHSTCARGRCLDILICWLYREQNRVSHGYLNNRIIIMMWLRDM